MKRIVAAYVGRSLGLFVIAMHFAHFAGPLFAADGVYNKAAAQASSTKFWHPHKVASIKFSPDGKSILSIAGDERFQWKTKTGELQQRKKWTAGKDSDRLRLPKHKAAVIASRVSNDGKRLVTLAADNILRRWDLASSKLLKEITLGEIGTTNAVFSSDGKVLALGDHDSAARIFDVDTGREINKFGTPESSPHYVWRSSVVGFSPDGKRLVTRNTVIFTGQQIVKVWNLSTGKNISSFPVLCAPDLARSGVALSPDGRLLASAFGNQIFVWEVATKRRLSDPIVHTHLRPFLAKNAPREPLRLAIHWTSPERYLGSDFPVVGSRDHRIDPSGPRLVGSNALVTVLDYGARRWLWTRFVTLENPSRGFFDPTTIESLQFHITTPKGKKHTVRPKGFTGQKLFDETFLFTLDQARVVIHFGFRKLKFKWAEKDVPSLDDFGPYKMSVSGRMTVQPWKTIEFHSGAVTVQRGAMDCLPLAEIRQLALEKVVSLVAKEDRPKIKASGVAEIVDNRTNERIVSLHGGKAPAFVERQYRAVVLVDGTVVQVTGGFRFTCIAAGTPIMTADGVRTVEELRIGDTVWGYDLARKTRVLTTIRAIRRSVAAETLLFGKSLRVTPSHPIFASGVWKSADNVAANDLVLNTEAALVPAGEPRQIGGRVDVFDLTVDVPHNFFAGGMLVHNKTTSHGYGSLDPWQLFETARGPRKELLFVNMAKLQQWQPDAERLDLSGAKIADDDVKHVAKLVRLKSLNLSGTPIGSDAVKHLKKMTSLTELSFANTQLDATDVAALRKALPKAMIILRSAAKPRRE